MALLPDGRVVVVADNLGFTNGPMASSPIAILNDKPTIPTLTPIKLSGNLLGRFMYGVALAPDGKTAYVTTQTTGLGFVPGRLYSIDLTKTSAVTPTLLYTWPKGLLGKIAAGRDGVLYASRFDPSNTTMSSIEQISVKNNTTVVKSIPVSTKTPIIGPALVRATGQFVFVSAIWPNTVSNRSVLMSDSKGKLSLLAGPQTGGWGMPWAIDINNSFEAYGQTQGQDRHWFEEFPNPGGLPEVGNQKFSLTLRSQTAPLATFLAIGLGKSNIPFMGVHVLAQPTAVPYLSPSKSSTFLASIPNNPALRNIRVFVQGVYVERGGGWAATRGLDLSIR